MQLVVQQCVGANATMKTVIGEYSAMTQRHHPPEELLLDYASGSLNEAVSLVVSGHLHYCPECRGQVAVLEAIGGAMLEQIEPAPLSDSLLSVVMERLDEVVPLTRLQTRHADADLDLPAVIPHYLGRRLRQLPWRRLGRMFEEASLIPSSRAVKLSLMRFQAGFVMPMHTHGGNEYTLVLAGGYSDAGEQFRPGDFDTRDATQEHQPVVDDDGECLCLVALDAPVKLTGALGRLANPLLRW